jgi:hypothetical protein
MKASGKQIQYGRALEKKMKLKVSPWGRFSASEASDRIQELLLFQKYGVDPSSINWKTELASAVRGSERNKNLINAGETFRGHQ